MARADIYTLLPLDTYAAVMGIIPLHFNGARLPQVTPEPFTTTGSKQLKERPIWQQFGWQDTVNVSRDFLARTIATAEKDIAYFLGYWPAPQWTSQEVFRYPRPNRPAMYDQGHNVRSQFKELPTRYKKIISPGRRATTLIATPAVVYSDPNTNGWNTLATITAATTITNECEIKVYFSGKNGNQAWEIRPLKSVSIIGGVVTITVDSWLLFDPDVTARIPTGEITAIDGSDVANYVSDVEIRREFTDFAQPSAAFYWEREPTEVFPTNVFCCSSCANTGCVACSLITANGCAQIRDVENGLIAPVPATYNADSETWIADNKWAQCRAPDEVKIWYKSGLISEEGFRGQCDQLDPSMASTIAILATARLPWRFRSENSISTFIDFWRRDISESSTNTSLIFAPPKVLENPFGTRRGEVEAFRRLRELTERKIRAGAVAA